MSVGNFSKCMLSLALACTLMLGACTPMQSRSEAGASKKDMRPTVERVVFTIGSDKMYIGDREYSVKAPYIVNDTTLVPVRAVTEGLGAQVDWDGAENEVSVSRDGVSVVLTIGETAAQVNGQEIQLLCAPALDGDTTMVPVRVISEAFGMDVGYDGLKENVIAVRRSFSDAVTVDAAEISAAAGIIACGMMQIYDSTGDTFYYEAAKRIFKTLYESYSTKDDAKNEGLILHATGHKPNSQNVDVSLIYGDYYFAELTERLDDKL